MRKEDSLERGTLSAQSFILDLVGVKFAWGQTQKSSFGEERFYVFLLEVVGCEELFGQFEVGDGEESSGLNELMHGLKMDTLLSRDALCLAELLQFFCVHLWFKPASASFPHMLMHSWSGLINNLYMMGDHVLAA